MTYSTIETPPQATLLSLISPPFRMRDPSVRHRDRIPPEPLRAMEASWHKRVFPERTVTFARLNDVYVVEEGLVFDATGALYKGSITQHAKAEIERGHRAVVAAISSGTAPRITGTSVLCKKRGVRNFGHWLVEMLPKACLAKLYLGAGAFSYIVPDVDGALRQVITDSLGMLQIDANAIHRLGEGVTHVESLILVEGLTYHGVFMSPLVMTCMDALAARVRGAGYKKVLVTRRQARSRRYRNEQDIEQQAVARGFHLVDPGSLTLAEQIAAFKDATEIVGIMGAEMANLAFAPRGAGVCNVAPASMPDTFFWFIAGLRGLDYRELRCEPYGPIRGVAPWDVDLELDDADIDYALGGAAPGQTT